jgi:uncharacterized SAM-binding protein YcdF (DUF218 family)
MKKRILALSFFFLGIVTLIIFGNLDLTGNAISDYINFSYIPNVIALTLIFLSLILFMARKGIDAIIIPTGGGAFDKEEGMYQMDRDRARTAWEHGGDLDENGYFVISGYKGGNQKEISEGQSYSIYKFLRRHGIKPSQMMVEGKSHDTLQNVIYTLKKIKAREQKEGDEKPWDVAFVSYPGHLDRFEDFVKQAEKKGIVEKGEFIFHKIPTGKDTKEERKYENNPLRRLSHLQKLATMERYKAK